jgi:hypothetical protein
MHLKEILPAPRQGASLLPDNDILPEKICNEFVLAAHFAFIT